MGHKLQNSEPGASFSLSALIKAAEAQAKGENALPVERWHPEYCGQMDMVIRHDGSWWHEGSPIGREKLVRLFSKILRKDEDGQTYLVTPAEKIQISVETAHFLAVRLDRAGQGREQSLIFTTNMDEQVKAGPDRPLRVVPSDLVDGPVPLLRVRGQLDALLTRAVYYELAEYAVEHDGVMGVWSDGAFFPIAPSGA